MNNFIPNDNPKSVKVPYFEDVSSDEGWQGHTTSKSIDTLKAEIAKAISRLGGIVSGFQSGVFNIDGKKREGYQIHYALGTPGGKYVPGRMDIAALPIKDGWHKTREKRREQSMKMALYMLRMAVDGMWFLQQLSPGYAPLMPWMIASDGKTVSQLWAESSMMTNLLPPGKSEFIEGELIT